MLVMVIKMVGLTVIWRDWDQIIHNPKMIYVNSVNPGEIKGPHIHKNRTSYFYCIYRQNCNYYSR